MRNEPIAAKGPLTWYKWKPLQWGSNRRIQKLNLAERGLLRELMDEAWTKGSIPEAPEAIADLLDMDLEEIKPHLPGVLRVAISAEAGGLTFEMIEEVRTELDARRIKCQAAANARWDEGKERNAIACDRMLDKAKRVEVEERDEGETKIDPSIDSDPVSNHIPPNPPKNDGDPKASLSSSIARSNRTTRPEEGSDANGDLVASQPVREVIETWNAICIDPSPFAKIPESSIQRHLPSILARIAEPDWLNRYRMVVENAPKLPFYCGQVKPKAPAGQPFVLIFAALLKPGAVEDHLGRMEQDLARIRAMDNGKKGGGAAPYYNSRSADTAAYKAGLAKRKKAPSESQEEAIRASILAHYEDEPCPMHDLD